MHTRLLTLNETMPPRSHRPNLEKALRHDCVIRSDWQYLIDTLEAVLNSSCTARVVIISEFLAIDYEMTDHDRWWALDRALAHSYNLRVWQLYDQIKAQGRIEMCVVPFRGVETVLQEFGVTQYIDQSYYAFTVVPASRQANRIVWEDASPPRVTWSMQEFENLWSHPWGMLVTSEHLDRLMKAHEVHAVAVKAAHLDWLTPSDIHVLNQLVAVVRSGGRKLHLVTSFTSLIVRMVYLAHLHIHHQRQRVLICVPDMFIPDVQVMMQQLQLLVNVHEYLEVVSAAEIATVAHHGDEFACVLLTDDVISTTGIEHVLAKSCACVVFAQRSSVHTASDVWRVIKFLARADESLLGSLQSLWQQQATVQRLLTHGQPTDDEQCWDWYRNPLPASELHPVFARVRTSLRINEMQTIAHRMAWHTQLVPSDRTVLLNFFHEYIARYSPLTQATVSDLNHFNSAHTQYIEFDYATCINDINAVIHTITTTLRHKQHCLCWFGEGIDVLPIQRACQAIEHVRFVLISDRMISVDGQIISSNLLKSMLQSGDTCIVMATPSVRSLVWHVLQYIDTTIALAVGPEPLISNRKRTMSGIHRRFHWDALQHRQIETIVNDDAANLFTPLQLAEITGELVYQIVQ
ncbi:MAG: hypothetical protein FJ040_11300 [Chloroflexi bacterium]|nr:hypothetical protein [Chloroflexota bacterium]